MWQHRAMLIAALVLACVFLTGASAMAGPSARAVRGAAFSGTWGTAEQVPGSNALNKGGRAGITSVSCASAGNCSAGGFYASGIGANDEIINQALVVTESGGRWRTAQGVPGTAALNTGGYAHITSISCSTPGDCGAGGYYTDASGNVQAFVTTETGGTWHTAQEVPGTAALDQASPGAEVLSVSCAAAGNCSAGGFYTDASGQRQAFVATETGSTWHTAQEVPGTSALNGGGYAEITSMSCAAAGDCSAGGEYTNSTPATEAFVVSQVGGTWSTAHAVRGIGVLNSSGFALVNSVSCASPGDCSAVGSYEDANFNSQAFVVGQSGGTWGTGREVPGTASLDQGSPGASAVSVSCGAVGDCSLGGYYSDASGLEQAFVASETGGSWAAAYEVPGTAALNAGGAAATDWVSCASAGNCSAGGYYTTTQNSTQAFVADETGSP
jgi:hypothetical protein